MFFMSGQPVRHREARQASTLRKEHKMNRYELAALARRTREAMAEVAEAERLEVSTHRRGALRTAYVLLANEANALTGQRARLARVAA